MIFLETEGSAYERGIIHGEALKKHIPRMNLYTGMIRYFGYTSFDLFAKDVLDNTSFLSTAKKWAPELIDEIQGIADGAKIEFNSMFVRQLIEEMGWYSKLRASIENLDKLKDEFKTTTSQQCSALGVFDQSQGHPIIAQNADNSPAWVGLETLIHAKDPESAMEWYHITYPGLIGIYGMNNSSVGVCGNTLSPILKKNSNGLGALFVFRIIMNQKSLKDAVDIIQKIPHASGVNYIIGDGTGVVDYECSPNQVKQFLPHQGSTRLYHTNHPIENIDVDDEYLELLNDINFYGDYGFENWRVDTKTRLDTLKHYLQDNSRSITIEMIKKILSSHDVKEHPICRHDLPSGAHTNMGLIMELSKSPKLHISFGAPCKAEFSLFEFSKEFSLKSDSDFTYSNFKV